MRYLLGCVHTDHNMVRVNKEFDDLEVLHTWVKTNFVHWTEYDVSFRRK